MSDPVHNIDLSKTPNHIAIIMDGNGRWAKKKGVDRLFGHRSAIHSVRDTIEGCAELKIKHLTLFTFSTENWNRPKMEVNGLMNLLVNTIEKELPTLTKYQIKLTVIGDISSLPPTPKKSLQIASESTKDYSSMELTLALNYSGQWDITNAVKSILTKEICSNDVTEDMISKHLSTQSSTDPELLIRTSGEMRISNFFLWQLAYTELFFTDILWPDFRKKHLFEAIESYQKRERRFGKISEQLS